MLNPANVHWSQLESSLQEQDQPEQEQDPKQGSPQNLYHYKA